MHGLCAITTHCIPFQNGAELESLKSESNAREESSPANVSVSCNK